MHQGESQAGEPEDGSRLVPVEGAALHVIERGAGPALIALHGGPEFDHTYLRPGLDPLASIFRLIYYDQRGRGRSQGDPDQVGIQSEIDDLDALILHLDLTRPVLLGHSWGGLLALLYALQHPDRVSRLVLLNTAPVSHEGILKTRERRLEQVAHHLDRMTALRGSARYEQGDPEAVADYYDLLFSGSVHNPECLDRLDFGVRHWTQEQVLRARRLDTRLCNETFWSPGYDLSAQLQGLKPPTLLIHGESDIVPVECASAIAQAIPDATLMVLEACGHFAFLEAPEQVWSAIAEFCR